MSLITSQRSDSCDLEIGALERIANEGQLMVYRHRGFWACMDTLREIWIT